MNNTHIPAFSLSACVSSETQQATYIHLVLQPLYLDVHMGAVGLGGFYSGKRSKGNNYHLHYLIIIETHSTRMFLNSHRQSKSPFYYHIKQKKKDD